MVAQAIGAAGSVLSGLGALGFGSDEPKPDYTQAKRQIRWTVNDAKKAGIHPLYALGQSTGAAPVTIGGKESPLSGIGNAMGAYSQAKQNASSAASQQSQAAKITDAQVRQSDAQARLANKQADLVEQQAIDSHVARMGPKMNAQQDSDIANLYTPFKDNKTGETIWLVNPETGLDAPELLGAAYWGQAKSYQSSQQPRKNPSARRPSAGRPRHYLNR